MVLLSILVSIGTHAQTGPVNPFDTTIYGRNPQAGRFVQIRGFRMYYETYGQGEPLLIIHGNGGSINNFLYQIPYFSTHYKVILADSRAHGRSIDTGDSLSYEMMTDDLNALLDTLKVKQANVIGWSDGGINGLLLAIRHPEKVWKLAITGANLWPDSTAVDPWGSRWAKGLNDEADAQYKTGKLDQQAKNGRKVIHLLSYEPHITIAQLKSITCPTLVIGGDHDIILAEHTLLIAKNIPRSYCWILPNSGHSTPIYYKDDFNRIVHDFFSKPFRKIEGEGLLQ